ncbi:pentapeptide repeat-containing protein [Sphingobium sp. MI1205]|nr:pentapeptide repeat-containing protein [Sphingobium sp. MI1205]
MRSCRRCLPCQRFRQCVLQTRDAGSRALEQCKLAGADLTDLRAINLRLDETLLIDAKLPGLSFYRTTVNRIDLSQADLRKCDFRQASFIKSSLRGADLGDLRLVDATLFRGARRAGQAQPTYPCSCHALWDGHDENPSRRRNGAGRRRSARPDAGRRSRKPACRPHPPAPPAASETEQSADRQQRLTVRRAVVGRRWRRLRHRDHAGESRLGRRLSRNRS